MHTHETSRRHDYSVTVGLFKKSLCLKVEEWGNLCVELEIVFMLYVSKSLKSLCMQATCR